MTVADMTREFSVDDAIRRCVRALASGRGVTIEQVADGVQMNRATLYRRLKGRGGNQAFTAGEVARLALFFGVPVSDLYDGMGGRFLRAGPPGPDAGPGGGAGALPRLDSNQEPAGNRPHLVPRPRRAPSLPHVPGGPYREIAA